jgi:hypothetical protein
MSPPYAVGSGECRRSSPFVIHNRSDFFLVRFGGESVSSTVKVQHVSISAIQKEIGSGTNPSRCHCTALRRRCRLPFHRCAICRSNSDRWHLPLSLAASRQAATAFILAGSSKQPSMAGPQTPKDRVVRFATAAIGRMDGRRLLWKGSQLASSAFLEL